MKTIIKAQCDEWCAKDVGFSLEEIAQKIGCQVSQLRIIWTKAEQEYELEKLPEEFRSAISYMAYERGHSAGEDEVLSILKELVSDLLPSIKAFEKRLTNKS